MHASDNVNRILVANKADIDESKRAVAASRGQALADEFGIKFFEAVSSATGTVDEALLSDTWHSLTRPIRLSLACLAECQVEPECGECVFHHREGYQAASGRDNRGHHT